MLKLTVAFLLLAIPAALAACPNACSGHGKCGKFDMCTCHTNWEGGDCSKRVCPFNWAWVTTSNGDLNFDGDKYDGTEYNEDYPFTQGDTNAKLVTQRSPGGTWENWPYYANGKEAHFYMECSNRGLCDRSTGQCKCFDGYTGAACRRSVCPDDCSGHGTCETISEMAKVQASSLGNSAVAYKLWDKDMRRTCLCDAGYTGSSCSERLCPYGDDPLTTDQYNEIQWVDVSADAAFAGNLAFKYTDYYGETWTSDYFAVTEMKNGATTSTFNTNAKNVLKGIPNDVITDATVSTGYCESVITGNYKLKADGTDFEAAGANAATYVPASGDIMRCSTAYPSQLIKIDGTGKPKKLDGTTALDATTTSADEICFKLSSAYCLRFKIEFTGTPGNLKKIEGVTDKVTVGGKTTAQQTNGIGSTSHETITVAALHATGGTTVDHKLASGVTTTCTTTPSSSAKKHTCGASMSYNTKFGKQEMVKLECEISGSTNYKSLGYYTVSSTTAPTDTELSFEEAAPSCSTKLKVTLISEFLTVNADVSSIVTANSRIAVNSWNAIPGHVTKVLVADGSSRIFLSAKFGDSDATTDGTKALTIVGAGTTEATECSDRGLCARDVGICSCFKGYTGDACEKQNSLSA